MTKIFLTIVTIALGALLTAGGIIYDSLAEDVKENTEDIKKLDDALDEIRTYQAVDKAQQESQTEVLKAVLEELRKDR